ncbi:MAG: cupin [Burkholderiaceae bacterium]|nr:cupin [Burkholderiaceae bacterium]MCD8516970.1 cupin [Burkholderiaceae bacterium]MCD8536803.1 cupin [Burkholderiaceae bacterium]MCD8565679.1 cupin [Burkholderiaceae bacterium]
MNADSFHKMVTAEGFSEPVLVEREANGFMDMHTHPFEAKALILDGYIEIGSGSDSRRYESGDVFHLLHEQTHWERYGPKGVLYLAARKAPCR